MALKRLPDPDQDIPLPAVRLWLDDIQELRDILAENGAKVRIEADNVEADEVADLSQFPEPRIKRLKLERLSAGPTIRVEIAPRFQKITLLHPGSETLGIAHRAAKMLRQRPRRLAASWSMFVSLLVALLFVATYIGEARGLYSQAIWIPFAALLVLVGVGSIVVPNAAWVETSLIIARRKVDSPGLLRRNRDQLVVGGLLTLLGGVVGFLFGLLA